MQRSRDTLADVLDPERYTAHQAEDPDFNPWQNEFSPGLRECEACALVFYSGHATQFGGNLDLSPRESQGNLEKENYIVPTDAPLNPSKDECIPVKSAHNKPPPCPE